MVSYITAKFDSKVAQLLKRGAVGCLPTDTIYGLSAQALDEQAVERIHRLKDRNQNKPLIVLISNIRQLSSLGIDSLQLQEVMNYWPGALSVICQAPQAPTWLERGTDTLAVRLPKYRNLQQLIEQVGPIVSTSVNVKDDKPANSLQETKQYFGDQLDFYVDGGDLSDRQPSTLVQLQGGQLKIIRPGAVKIDVKENL